MASFNLISCCIFNVLLLPIIFVSSAKLPNDFKRCHQKDPNISECLRQNVKDALLRMKNGIPDLGILPLEPLRVDSLTIGGGKGPVNVQQQYKNMDMIGLTESKLTKYDAQLANNRIYTESVTPSCELLADYELQGQVLVLPLRGKGRCNLTMTELVTEHELIFEPFEKKGKKYARLTDYKVKFTPKRLYLHFENLFNGDKALGDQMNRFLNENWDLIFQDLKPNYEETFGLVFKEIANRIFTKVPYDDIFLPD